jgi:signal transduction histidine kinase
MPHVLVVDDEEKRRSAIVDTISRRRDYAVDQCGDRAAARERLARQSYDVMLVGLELTDAAALGLCADVRANPATEAIPILLLMNPELATAGRLEGIDLGATDYVGLPVGSEPLLARIEFALRLKSLADRVRLQNAELESKVRERTRTAEALADALRAERDTLRETLDVFEDAVVLLGASMEVLVANAAGQRVMTTALKPAILSWVKLVVPGAPPRDQELVDGARIFLGRAYPLRGERVLLYLRDVTLAREGEVRRLQAEKMASIGILAAGVAHEINNPAAFVLGNFDALSMHFQSLEERLRSVEDPAFKTAATEIVFESNAILQESKEGMARILRIVRSLSSFTHVDDDQVAPTDVNTAVDSTLGILRNELRHRATVDRDLQAKRLVRSTPARLGQVFLNLIMNAIQAVDEARGRDNRIRVRTYDHGDDVIFEVTDNGTGIAPAVLPRIFDSFFTTKPRGIGTGLGLPISQGIVNALGGQITVETENGRGTLFRVRMPGEAPRILPALPPRPATPPHYSRRRILAVDDEALLLKAYRRMISDTHEVVTALGGRDALLVLRKRQDFDVILCDLQMPEMSGMELFMTAKREFPELAPRFVFVTGGAFSTEARHFLEQAVTCLNKPFSVDELMGLIEAKVTETGGAPSEPERGPRDGARVWTEKAAEPSASRSSEEGQAVGRRDRRPDQN